MFSRKLTVVCLSIIVLVNTLSTPLILLDFNLRKDYIYKVLCINNDKPITVCGGKCYLSKRLKKTSDATDQNKESKTRRTQAPELFKSFNTNIDSSNSNYKELTFEFYPLETIPLSGYTDNIFHPPQMV